MLLSRCCRNWRAMDTSRAARAVARQQLALRVVLHAHPVSRSACYMIHHVQQRALGLPLCMHNPGHPQGAQVSVQGRMCYDAPAVTTARAAMASLKGWACR